MRLLATVLLALPALAFAQGSLSPAGAPAPSMKTLAQIEPRTPLEDGIPGLNRETNGGFTIQNPGSYYLTGNLTVPFGTGIAINAGNVTLDLNGFTIASNGSGSGGTGITTAASASGITIRNGFIRGGASVSRGVFSGVGLLHGINAANSFNLLVENISVQGVLGTGITVASGNGIIRACSARICGSIGLRASQVLDSTALQCGDTAIYAGTAAPVNEVAVADGIATNCFGESLANGRGVFALTASNCTGVSESGPGIEAKTATAAYGKSTSGPALKAQTVSGCFGTSVSGYGIDCTIASNSQGYSYYLTGLTAATATNCYGSSNSGWGLYAQNATTCHGATETGDYGLRATDTAESCSGTVTSAPDSVSRSDGAYGLRALVANNCRGTITTSVTANIGLRAENALNCRGEITTGGAFSIGLKAQNAFNSYGAVPTAGLWSAGMSVDHTASNCIGIAGDPDASYTGQSDVYGLMAQNASGCYGAVVAGTGLQIAKTASYCTAKNNRNATALSAAIAIGCTSEKGPIVATRTFLMLDSP